MNFINSKTISDVKDMISENSNINMEVGKTNLRRLHYMCLASIPVSLAHVIKFLFFTATDSVEEKIWRLGIIAAHLTLMVTSTILGLLSSYMTRKAKLSIFSAFVVQYIGIALIMIVGVAIVTIDQLVTPNVTPFIIVCAIIALVFLVRPTVSISIYLAVYFMYYFFLGITQSDKAILLSNQVNGITAIGIGICLSIILWKNNVKSFRQRECIERQKKELEDKNKKLAYLAACDSMTGLINRREFERIVNHELSRMRRYEYNSCIVMTDIDLFKNINDKYGHPVGDELLKQFSVILKNELREFDVVARWGGEEFIILLPDTSLKDGMMIAERLRQVVEKNEFNVNCNLINMTASFGVAELSYTEAESFKKSYESADSVLYEAKEEGRNCVKGEGAYSLSY